MKIPSSAFNNVLNARGLDIATLAGRSGVSKRALQRAIQDEGELDDDDIKSVAEELAVPVQALFAERALPLFPSVDFRSATPGIGEFAKGTLQAINFVERLSSTFSSLKLDVALDSTVKPFRTNSYSNKEAAELADEWRTRWGIQDKEQLEWQDANKLYGSLRSFIEGLGILVTHRQFKTDEAAGIYVHVKDGPHTIVINTTKSSKARKLFTLAHEFCHILLREEGASNPSILKNKVEKFCNRFAACLLAPERLIRKALERFGLTPKADDNWIRIFAKRLGLSQEATYLRLVETGYLNRSDYRQWKAKFHNTNHIPTGDMDDGQGGGRANPLRDKQTQYGTALLALLKTARTSGLLDAIDVYRLSGLKPKYQEQLFGVS